MRTPDDRTIYQTQVKVTVDWALGVIACLALFTLICAVMFAWSIVATVAAASIAIGCIIVLMLT